MASFYEGKSYIGLVIQVCLYTIPYYEGRYAQFLEQQDNTVDSLDCAVILRACLLFKESLHPDEKQRQQLNKPLGLAPRQIIGERGGLILESSNQMGETLNGTTGLDINNKARLIEEKLKELLAEETNEATITLALKDFGIKRAMVYGWPNTYVFTNATGEMLLEHLKENTNVIIVRPTIVTSTFKEPFSGWVEGIRLCAPFWFVIWELTGA